MDFVSESIEQRVLIKAATNPHADKRKKGILCSSTEVPASTRLELHIETYKLDPLPIPNAEPRTVHLRFFRVNPKCAQHWSDKHGQVNENSDPAYFGNLYQASEPVEETLTDWVRNNVRGPERVLRKLLESGAVTKEAILQAQEGK